MSIKMASFFCCFIIAFLFASLCPPAYAQTDGFTVDLLHSHHLHRRHHHHGHHHNHRHHNHHNHRHHNRSATTKPNGSELLPNNELYFFRLYVGNPAVAVYVAADTGSDLLWIQTPSACPNCAKQGIQLYDSTQSSSYIPVHCQDSECTKQTQGSRCGVDNECQYTYTYGDNSGNTGIINRDTVSVLPPKSAGTVEYPGIVFGSALQVGADALQKYHAGIAGLNMGDMSLVSQLGLQKFSYCLQPMYASSHGKITFGNDVKSDIMTGATKIPLIKKDASYFNNLYKNDSWMASYYYKYYSNFYYLNLEGATVMGSTNKLLNNRGNTTYSSTVLVDSGSALTYLEPKFYKSLEDEIRSKISLKDLQWDLGLCYSTMPENIEAVFHFTGGDVRLKTENLFRNIFYTGDYAAYCLAFQAAAGDVEMSRIWGSTSQLNFQVTYDIKNRFISFAPDCAHNL